MNLKKDENIENSSKVSETTQSSHLENNGDSEKDKMEDKTNSEVHHNMHMHKRTESENVVSEKKEENDNLEEKSNSLAQKLATYEDLLKRQMADFDNFRKRAQDEKEKLKDFVLQNLMLEFLPIFDNIERAFEASKSQDAKLESIVEGLSGIMQLFDSFLVKNEVEKVNSIDQEFNPEMHEALFTSEGDYSKKTVIQEVEAAYRHKGKVIRTAKVAVGIPKSNQEEK